jgi:hypothetical protein
MKKAMSSCEAAMAYEFTRQTRLSGEPGGREEGLSVDRGARRVA